MAWLQASSVVINLLPVPSFDGFGAIEQWLPDTWRPDGLTRSIAGFTAIFLIFMIDPMARAMLVLIYLVIAPFGFDLHDIRTGYSALAFWAR